jgi:hypothetical protein
MKQSLKYTWMNLSRSVLFLLPTGILSLLAVLMPFTVPTDTFLITAVSKGLLINMIIFPVMAFLTYVFAGRLTESREKEALYAEEGIRRKLLLSLLVFLFAVLLLYCLLQFSAFCVKTFAFGIRDGRVYWHFAKAVLLYGCLPGLIGIACGLWLSGDRNGRSFVLILIFAVLFSPLMNDLLPNSIFGFWNVDEWVRIAVPNWWILSNSAFTDPLYGVPMETVRWVLALFWLGVFLFLWLLEKAQRKTPAGKIGLAVILCLTLLCGLRFSLRNQDSRLNYETGLMPEKGINTEDFYYYESWNRQTESRDPNVKVTAYDLDLKIRSHLTGRAALKLEEPAEEGEVLLFTMYHGLKVRTVTDADGREIPFVQDGDWLDITPDRTTDQLTVSYEGRFAKFYTNRQAVLLPAYAAYYPIPGHITLWEAELQYTVPVENQPKREFTVRVDSVAPIACSLPMMGKAEYSGVSDGVTLIGGFWQTSEADGFTLYSPVLEKYDLTFRREEINRNLTELTVKLGAAGSDALDRIRQIFALPTSMRVISGRQENCVIKDNHFTYIALYDLPIDYSAIAAGILRLQYKLDSQTVLLYEWLQKYLQFPMPMEGRLCTEKDLEPLLAQARGEDVPARDVTNAQRALKALFYYRLYQLKEDKFLPLVYEYLTDENRTLHPAEFLLQMEGEQ